jgi:hypothetical protein
MPVVDCNQTLATSSRAESFGSKAELDIHQQLWDYKIDSDENLDDRQSEDLTRWTNLQLHFGIHQLATAAFILHRENHKRQPCKVSSQRPNESNEPFDYEEGSRL